MQEPIVARIEIMNGLKLFQVLCDFSILEAEFNWSYKEIILTHFRLHE